MAIVKEFECLAHGRFESDEARCPHGCTSTIERKFFTAPGLVGAATKGTDATLRRLAERFGYTDMSNKNGSSIASNKRQPKGFEPLWQDVPKGNVLEIGGGERTVEGAVGGAEAAGRAFNTAAIANELMATRENPLPTGGKLPKIKPNVVATPYGNQQDFDQALRRA